MLWPSNRISSEWTGDVRDVTDRYPVMVSLYLRLFWTSTGLFHSIIWSPFELSRKFRCTSGPWKIRSNSTKNIPLPVSSWHSTRTRNLSGIRGPCNFTNISNSARESVGAFTFIGLILIAPTETITEEQKGKEFSSCVLQLFDFFSFSFFCLFLFRWRTKNKKE